MYVSDGSGSPAISRPSPPPPPPPPPVKAEPKTCAPATGESTHLSEESKDENKAAPSQAAADDVNEAHGYVGNIHDILDSFNQLAKTAGKTAKEGSAVDHEVLPGFRSIAKGAAGLSGSKAAVLSEDPKPSATPAVGADPTVDAPDPTNAAGAAAKAAEGAKPAEAAGETDNALDKVLEGSSKYLGPVAALGGGLSVYEGLEDKNKVAGGLEVAGGASNTVAGVATTVDVFGSGGEAAAAASGVAATGEAAAAGAAGVAETGTAATVAGAGITAAGVAGVAGGVGAVADGALSIYNGVQNGNNQEIAAGSIKSVGGGLMIAGACTGQPELVVAGGAVYLGGVVTQNWQGNTNFAGKAAGDVGNFASSAASDVGNVASSAVNDVGSAASGAVHDAGSVLSDLNPF